MLRGIYTAAAGLINTQAKQDAGANNIANANTPGYKQDKVVAKPFPEVMLQNKAKISGDAVETRNLGKMSFGVENGEAYTDFTQGDMLETGSDLDFALSGKGFFSVQYFDGIRDIVKYTRDGSFKLDSDGRIVTQDGGYLLGRDIESGWTTPMQVGSGKVTINNAGILSVDGVEKYSFDIKDFVDYSGIEKEGRSTYRVIDENTRPIDLESGQYSVQQGKIEQSNIDIGSEMVNMIENLRSFQANQRVLQAIDQTLGKTVNEVGALR